MHEEELNYHETTAPTYLRLQPPWDHGKVFWALVNRGEKRKDPTMQNIYVQLYSQSVNCAVLYAPGSEAARRDGPLHLNQRAESWNGDKFQEMKPFIQFKRSDNKGPGKEKTNFDWYCIKNWDGFAASLGL
jgi:hypothetical protein